MPSHKFAQAVEAETDYIALGHQEHFWRSQNRVNREISRKQGSDKGYAHSFHSQILESDNSIAVQPILSGGSEESAAPSCPFC